MDSLWDVVLKVYGPLGLLALSGWAAALLLFFELRSAREKLHEGLVSTTAAMVRLTVLLEAGRGISGPR